MRRSTFLIRTSVAKPAIPSRLSRCSTKRRPELFADGRGTPTASNADVRPAVNMAAAAKSYAIFVSANGDDHIQAQRQASISDGDLRRNTGSRLMRLNGCARPRMGAARSATEGHRDYSSIIAIPKDMFERFFARLAIHSWGGTKGRLTRSCASKNTLRRIITDQPCHADLLLMLANRRKAPLDINGFLARYGWAIERGEAVKLSLPQGPKHG